MSQIADVLARFGSVRAASQKIGRPPSVIQYWRSKNRVPATSQEAVLDAAARCGIALEPEELIARAEKPMRSAA